MLRGTRRAAVLAVALGLLATPGSSSAGPRGAVGPASALQSALVRQVNAFRSAHGLPRLRESRALDAAASAHSSQMARLGFFSHSSANGRSFSQRIAAYYPARGFRRWSAGENLVYGSPHLPARQARKLGLPRPPPQGNPPQPPRRQGGPGAGES